MKKHTIKIGFEIGTGDLVNIPLAHTVVTGLTHESGKTTCITGLIQRSGLKAIIFKTKVGERAITDGTVIPPFYKEDFDWEYAMELLESARKEKLKFERSWIIQYSNGAKNLLEFKRNIDTALADEKIRALDRSVLLTLQAYLDKILPELQFAPLSKTLDIREGINIMDLERFKEETQSLIIRSVINEVLQKEKNTIIVLPECWKYLPERISNPVKQPAEAFIRQGATNNNYLWMDSQDITGVSKTILKQVSNWILGYQREINEIKRTLDQIPLSKKNKPQTEDIATLKLGHFFVATSDFTKRIYAQPIWLEDKIAEKVALGKMKIEDIEQPTQIAPFSIMKKEVQKPGQQIIHDTGDTLKKINELRNDFLANRSDFFTKFEQINDTISKIHTEIFSLKQEKTTINEDEIVMRVLQKVPVSTSGNINKQEIVAEILSKIPRSGSTTVYEIAPLEKIRKDFLEEAKNKIIDRMKNLDHEQMKMLKWIEQNGKATNKNELFLHCFGKSYTTGNAYNKLKEKVTQMKQAEIIRVDTAQRIFPYLRDLLKNLLGPYEATDNEIENVYNHILMEILEK